MIEKKPPTFTPPTTPPGQPGQNTSFVAPLLTLPKWVRVLAIIAVIGIIASILIKFLTPKPSFIPKTSFVTENSDGSTTKFSQIVFKGALPELKTSLPIVSVIKSETSFSTIKEDLFSTYDLKPVTGANDTWSGSKYFFYYDQHQDSYILNANFDPPTNKYLTDVPGLILAAEEFVGTTFPGLEVSSQKNSITYLKGIRHVDEVANSFEANFIKISFSYTVNDIPAYLEHRETEIFTITINAQGEVQKIVFQPDFVTLTPIKEVQVVPFDQALININNNEASIVSAYEKSTGIFSLEEVVSGELTEASLEYRLDLESEIGYPFYKFRGKLINLEGKIIEAEIITPAVLVQ